MSTRASARTWSKGSARNDGPQQSKGTVRIVGDVLQRCDDCGLYMSGAIPQGRHALMRRDGALRNCVGRPVCMNPECGGDPTRDGLCDFHAPAVGGVP